MTKTEIQKQIEKNNQDLITAEANDWDGIRAYCLRRRIELAGALRKA